MSDFIDIIIRAQDLAGPTLAKVTAELEALKGGTNKATLGLNDLDVALRKLGSDSQPSFTKLRGNLERQVSAAQELQTQLAQARAEMQKLAQDFKRVEDGSVRTSSGRFVNKADAENFIKQQEQLVKIQEDAAAGVDRATRAYKNLGQGIKDVQNQSRSLGASLRREGLGPLEGLLRNVSRELDKTGEVVQRNQLKFAAFRSSMADFVKGLDEAADPRLVEALHNLDAGFDENAKSIFRARTEVEDLQRTTSRFRGELNGIARDLQANGQGAFGAHLTQIAQDQERAFHSTENSVTRLRSVIREMELSGEELDPFAQAAKKALDDFGDGAFKDAQKVEDFSNTVRKLKGEFRDISQGVDPFSEAGRQVEHLRKEIESLESPFARQEAAARRLAQATAADFPEATPKKLRAIREEAQHTADALEILGQRALRDGANFQRFEVGASRLRSAFQRIGAKNAAQDVGVFGQMIRSLNLNEFDRQLGNVRKELESITTGDLARAGITGKAEQTKFLNQMHGQLQLAESDLETFRRDVISGNIQLQNFERTTEKFGRTLAAAGFPLIGAQVDQIGNKAFRSADGLRRVADEMGRFAKQSNLQGLDKAERDFELLESRFRNAAVAADRLESGMKRGFFTLEGFAARASKAGSALGVTTTEMDRLKAATQNGNSTFGIFLRTLTVWASRMAILVFAFTGLTGVIGPLVGVVGSLAGGVGELVSAFSSLGGVLAGIPGALAAIGGSMFALKEVLQPGSIFSAVQGIIGAQKTLSGNNAKIPGSSSSGSDPRQQLKDAQQNLADSEQSLHDLRISDRQQEQQAELALQQARLQAAQSVIQAERDLIEVRRQAALQEQSLKDNLANAQGTLAGLKQEGASPEAILSAQADVRIAQRDLAEQQIKDQHDVGAAQQKVKDARINGALAIKQAEQSLANTIRTNARQETAAQEAVAKAMRQVADAQKGIKSGLQGSTSAANTFRAEMQRALFGLSPTARALVFQILSLRQAFRDLTGGVRDRGYQIFSQFIGFLQKNLRPIVAVVNLFAIAVENVAARLFRFIETPKNFQAIQNLFIQSVPLVEKFGQVLLPLVDIFIKIGNAAVPFTNFLADGAVKIAQFFDKLTSAGIASGSFSAFLKDSEETLTIVVHILEHLGGLLNNVFKAGADSGQSLLQLFDNFLARLDRITGTVSGQNKLKDFFQAQIPVMTALGKLLVSIADGFIQVTQALQNGPHGQNTLVAFLDRLRTGFVPFLVEFLTKFSQGIGSAFINLIAALGNLALAFADLSRPMANVIDALASIINDVAELITLIETRFPAAAQTFASLLAAFIVFKQTAGSVNATVLALSKNFSDLGGALNLLIVRFRLLVIALLVLNQFVDIGKLLHIFVVEPLSAIADAVRSVSTNLGPLQALLPAATLAFKALGVAITGALAIDTAVALGRTIGALKVAQGAVSALLVKLGLKTAVDTESLTAEELLTRAIQQNSLAIALQTRAQLVQVGATEAQIAANEELIATLEGVTAAEVEAGGGGVLGPALSGLAGLMKRLVLPVFAFFGETLLPLVADGLEVVAGILGISFGGAVLVVAALGIAFVALATNMFGVRDAAVAVVRDVLGFFQRLAHDLTEIGLHLNFDPLIKDAESAAGKVGDFFKAAFSGGNEKDFKSVSFQKPPAGMQLGSGLHPGFIKVDTPANEQNLRLQGDHLGLKLVDGFIAHTATLKGRFATGFEDAMTAARAKLDTALAGMQSAIERFSSTVGIILGTITETSQTPAEKKLARLQAEDERRSLEQGIRDAHGAKAKAEARRQLEEFNLQQQATRQRRFQDSINQIQQIGQQQSLQSLEAYLNDKNVSWQQKEAALHSFLKKSGLTRQQLINHFVEIDGKAGKKEGIAYYNALRKSFQPIFAFAKQAEAARNLIFGLTDNAGVAGGAIVDHPGKGHGPHAARKDIVAGQAGAEAKALAAKLGVNKDLLKGFTSAADDAVQGFSDHFTKGFGKFATQIGGPHGTIHKSVVDPTRKTLKTASPSKVFQAIGKDVVDGFILGLAGLRKKFIKVFAGVGSDTADFFASMAQFIGGKNGWGQVTKVFSQTIPDTFPAIRNHINTLWMNLLHDADTFMDKILKRLQTGWQDIRNLFVRTIPNSYDDIAHSIGSLWVRIGKGVNTGWSYIVNSLFGWESDLVTTMNQVLKRVGEKKITQIKKAQAPTVTAPTNFATGGIPYVGESGHGIVRPVPGGVYRVAEAGQQEAIISLDRKHRSRSLAIIGASLRHLGIPGFAEGGITDPGKAHSRFSGVPQVPHVPTFGKVDGIIKTVAVAAASMIKSAADKWFGNSILGVPGGPVPNFPVPSSAHIRGNIELGKQLAGSLYGWRGGVFNALQNLWIGESGWNEFAYNASSGAQGIPQFLPGLPGRPTPKGFPSTPPVVSRLQELWGMGYIHGAYGDPMKAYQLWLSRSPHWYHSGGEVTGRKGSDVPAVLQAGEWVLTEKHQGMLAKMLFGNMVPNPPNAPGGGGHGDFHHVLDYFKRLLAVVFGHVRGQLGGSMPKWVVSDGAYSRTTLTDSGGKVIPAAQRVIHFSHRMIRDVFANSSYGLGAILHEMAHAFQVPSIIKRGKSWIEGGAELFMRSNAARIFDNLGPEVPAERRKYHELLLQVKKEKEFIKHVKHELDDKSLTKAEKERLNRRLNRAEKRLASGENATDRFLALHPSANRKFHRIRFNLAAAEVPAYEHYLSQLSDEFAGDPHPVNRNQFSKGGAEKALTVRLAQLDSKRLDVIARIKNTNDEITKLESFGPNADSTSTMTNLQNALDIYKHKLEAALAVEVAFMKAHPHLRKQFPSLYVQLGLGGSGIDVGGVIHNPRPPVQSFRAGGNVAGGRVGDPVMVQAHVGEWVVNTAQQERLARVLGGWEQAKRYLFSTTMTDPSQVSFASGGMVRRGIDHQARDRTVVNAPVTIHTASPRVDIDYVSRVLEARMGRW